MAVAVAFLVATITLFDLTPLDLWIQDRFFNFRTGHWLIDSSLRAPFLVLHEFPRMLVALVCAGLLIGWLFPAIWSKRSNPRPPPRRAVLCALLTIISVPLVVATTKKLTNTFCPMETRRYGGDVCNVRLLEPYPTDAAPPRRGQCFPAAHASGGFALIGLCSLLRKRRAQLAVMGSSLALGMLIGAYQMLRGAHFMSHTLVSLGIAWLLCGLWRRAFGLARSAPPDWNCSPVMPHAA